MQRFKEIASVTAAMFLVVLTLGVVVPSPVAAPCHYVSVSCQLLSITSSLLPAPNVDEPVGEDAFQLGANTLYVVARVKAEGRMDDEGILTVEPGASGAVVFTIFHSPPGANGTSTEVVSVAIDANATAIDVGSGGSSNLTLGANTTYPVWAYFEFTVDDDAADGDVIFGYKFKVDSYSHVGYLGFRIESPPATSATATGAGTTTNPTTGVPTASSPTATGGGGGTLSSSSVAFGLVSALAIAVVLVRSRRA